MPKQFRNPLPIVLRGFKCPKCGSGWFGTCLDPETKRLDASDDPCRHCNGPSCGWSGRASQALDPADEYGNDSLIAFVEQDGTLGGHNGELA